MKIKITVEGKVYEVEVEVADQAQPAPGVVPPNAPSPAAPPPSSAPSPPSAAPSPAADETKVCRSPISGVVVRVPAQVGQAIQVNDTLLVLEAMKMETVITAPVAGKIARINATVGDTVTGGQVLVEFE